jgi:hypothetical protein
MFVCAYSVFMLSCFKVLAFEGLIPGLKSPTDCVLD